MRKQITESRGLYYGLLVVFALIIMFVSLRHVLELTNIVAWDELGYWGNGAYIAGYDWSSVVSTYAGYYSYGYSLIIAVLLKIFNNAHLAYQAAIVVNSFFNIGSFLLTNYVGIKLFNWKNKYYVLLTSVIVSIYVNNITQSNCAWTECELIFLYWCLVVLYMQINQKYKFHRLVLIIVVSIYIYCVHNRTVGILIASAITIVLFIILKKIPKKEVILLCFIMLGLIVVETTYKNIIKQNMYLYSSDEELVNTFSSASPWIVAKFKSFYGITDLLKTFLNRFLYFGIITFGTFWIFLINGVRKIYFSIRKKDINYFIFFVILSVLGIFGVMTLHLSQSGTYQALLYGRYQDIVLGPSFFMGMMWLISKTDKNKIFYYVFLVPIVMWILLIICKSIPIYNDYFVSNCNVSLYKFWIGTDNGGYDFNRIFVFTTLLTVLYATICYINKSNRKLGLALLTLFTIYYGINQVKESETVFNSFYTNYYDMSEELIKIHNICEDEEEIYYYNDKDLSITPQLIMWLQLEMYDHKIIVVNDLQQIAIDAYLVVPRRKISDTDFQATVQIDGELISDYGVAALYYIE